MLLDKEIVSLSLHILKNASKLRSFVLEEVALADLLTRAWLPVGKKIRKQLSSAINFKTGEISKDEALNFNLWVTPEMFNASVQKQWTGIEGRVKKYLTKAYRRAFAEKGKDPMAPVEKSDFDPYDESWDDEDWENDWQELSREGSALDKETDSSEVEAAIIGAFLALARKQFESYAEDVAVPMAQSSIESLRKLQGLETEVKSSLEEARRDGEASKEMERQLAAISQARSELLRKLQDVLEGAKHASTNANLTVARAHHFGFLDWADQNEVKYYRVTGVLDDKICGACLSMNDRVFAVSDAQEFRKKFLSVFDDKELLKQQTPFLTSEYAKSIRSYTVVKSDGLFFFPPFHPNCRCSVIAVYDENVRPEQQDGEKPYIIDPERFKREDFYEYTELSDVKNEIDAHYVEWANSITPSQKESIYAYKTSYYKLYNEALTFQDPVAAIGSAYEGRSYKEKKVDEFKRFLQNFKDLLDTSPPVQENIVTYRGIGDDLFKHLLKVTGVEGVDIKTNFLGQETWSLKNWGNLVGYEGPFSKSYSSTAFLKNVADAFPIADARAAQIKFYIPKGSRSGFYIDTSSIALEETAFDKRKLGDQTEMLLKPETKVKILSADEVTGIIEMLVLE
jgi:hypothetical protein